MLDRLGQRNNKFLLIIIFLLFSCGTNYNKAAEIYHTELICEGQDVILIRYSRLKEVRKAIIKSYLHKKKHNGTEKYTVISLGKNRSMRVDKLKPEDAINCNLREVSYLGKDKYRKQYIETPGYDFFH